MKTVNLNVNGMSCSHCERAVNEAVGGLTGVKEVSASVKTNTVSITFDEDIVTLEVIKETIKEEGYDVAD